MIILAQSLSLLPVVPLFPSEPWRNPKLCTFPHTQITQLSCNSPRRLVSMTRHKENVVCGSKSKDPKESVFFDENGVVEDMDGYLNYLSLEYDSVWDTKPSWCQPWTITFTGVLIVTLSWLILHSVLISTIVSTLICAWWYIFLYAYPKGYADMIAERRKKVIDGLEDTYGLGKGQ